MAAVPPKNYGISDFKSRALRLAQTSLYQITIVPPKAIFQNTEDITLLCNEAALPGSSLATHDVTNDYHGVTEKMAYRRIYDETVSMNFYVDRSYKVVKFFEEWIEFIAGQGTTIGKQSYTDPYVMYRMNYPQEYKSKLHIVKFEKDHHRVGRSPLPAATQGGPTLEYEFVGAFPNSITAMPVTYNQSEILKCNVSFYFIRYVVNTKSSTLLGSLPSFNQNPGNPETKSNSTGFSFNPTDFYKKDVIVNSQDFDYSKINKFRTDEYYNNFGDTRQDATNTANFFGAA